MKTSMPIPVCLLILASPVFGQHLDSEPNFPVTAELFIDEFSRSEGITFNAEGHLFIAADKGAWRAYPNGNVTRITDTYSNLGMARIGDRDILMADFGPTMFLDGPNDDGIIWRITPEGDKKVMAKGIADPNFILVRKDGTFLVSDDGTDKIYLVEADGSVDVWTSAIPYPNGMAFSKDESTIYVAQIFKQLDPILFDNAVWAIPVDDDGQPSGEPTLAGRVGEGGVDGLTMDEMGRIYVADNRGGKIWRIDPSSGESILITEDVANVASLVFGEGNFDHESIYATSTFRGGGKIWKVDVGVRGAPLNQ